MADIRKKACSGKMTLRDEDLLRKAMGQQAGLTTRRAEAREARAAAEKTTRSRPAASHPLADVLAWAKQQCGTERSNAAVPRRTVMLIVKR